VILYGYWNEFTSNATLKFHNGAAGSLEIRNEVHPSTDCNAALLYVKQFINNLE
jgi:hypothetical protein